MKEREIIINIERCTDKTVEEARKIDVLDELGNGENSVDLSTNKKEKRMSMSAKKPPRPPSALSLDAADQKLIKEISELLMIKRARIERTKALKKMKAASKPSTSSTSNFIAIFFTVLFCILIIYQVCHPSSTIGIHSSTKPNAGSNGSVHMLSEDGSPNLVVVPSLDNHAEAGKATH